MRGCRRLLALILILSISVNGLLAFHFTAHAIDIPADWWNTSWFYRRAIVIDHTKLGSPLENFPVLLDFADVGLKNKIRADGYDIVFVGSDGSKLDHEIEFFDLDSGHVVAWVRLPLLSSSEDTTFYMYYGNAGASNQQNPTGVWDADFTLVGHLKESSGVRYDSTQNGNNGAAYGGIGNDASGKIDGSALLDGLNDYLKFSTIELPANSITIDVWFKPLSYSNGSTTLAKFVNTGPTTGSGIYGFQVIVGKDKWSLGLSWDSKSQTFTLPVFTSSFAWNHLVVTWNGSYCYGYLNGVNVKGAPVAGSPDWYGKPLYVGTSYVPWAFFNGAIDELRISKISRSEEWIKTSHDNQENPSSFCNVGEEQSIGSGPSIYVYDESPTDGSAGQYTNPVLSASVIDSENGLLTIYFRTNASGTWQNIGVTQGHSGTFSVVPIDMNDIGITYFWEVCALASDGNTWANQTYSFSTTTKVLVPKWDKIDPRGGISGVLIADVNGDGSEDVVYAGGKTAPSVSAPGYVTARSGIDGSIIWQIADPAIGFWVQPQMADVNKDGTLEVLVPLQSPAGLLVLNRRNGAQVARRTGLGGVSFSSPVAADIDGDGYQEIFFCSTDTTQELNGAGRVTSLRYDKSQQGNLRILNQVFAWRPCSGGLSIADTNHDGEFELYMGDRSTGYGKGVVSYWARNLTERWSRPEIMSSSNIPMLADVNGDGILDVISGHMNGGVYVLNSVDGSIIGKNVSNTTLLPVHYQPSIYDIDRDGHLEMLMADGQHSYPDGSSSNDTVTFDLVTMRIDKRLNAGRLFYGPQVADVTGDGVKNMEIIACTYDGSIFVFNSTYSLIDSITNLQGAYILNYAVAQDIDNDGYIEVVVSSQSGRIYAFDTPARRPVDRSRSEVQFYSERRLGAAEYVAPPGFEEASVTSVSQLNLQENASISTGKLSFGLAVYGRDLVAIVSQQIPLSTPDHERSRY